MRRFIFLFVVCAMLISIRLAAQTSIIPFASSWKYLDDGSNQGTAWRAPSFNDGSWKSGQAKFGYGISDAATLVDFGPSPSKKYITTYFRKSITISDAAVFASYAAQISRDDGVVVYVNGAEVYRNNLPTGSISHTTLAKEAKDNGTVPQSFTISTSAFVSGTNIIAVEVHQAKANSPDLAFDLELSGTLKSPPANQPPTVNLSSPADNSDSQLGQEVVISAIASDPDGFLVNVEFFANGSKIGEDATSPYTYSWAPVSTGTYSLTAKATDNAGATTTSASVTVNVTPATIVDTTPPSVISINRHNPTTETTDATSLTYRVTFSEGVSGVDKSDFRLTTLSGEVTGELGTGAIAPVGTDGSTYDVTASSVSGNGILRLDLKSSSTGITDAAGNAIAGGFTNGESYVIEKKAPGFSSIINLDPIPVSTNTGEKPQSKVWTYDGKHWAVLPNSSGTHLWRLDGKTWTNVLRLSTRTTSKADCKLVGNVAHIFLYQGASSQLVSVEYVPVSGTYKLWTKRTSTVGITLDKGVETATIDIDGNGRMWLASAGVTDINVRWSDAPYSNWSSPITIATGVDDDDICAVIALPKERRIGVLWSNQVTKRFGFKTHDDGADPAVWSEDEAPASQSALDVGSGMADDHLNMALASDGTLYCAAKTSYDVKGYPKIILLIRRPSGAWENLHEVSQFGTRPIVILNETIGKIRIVYSSQEFGGDILYKESPTGSLSLSPQFTLIKGGTFDNSTSTKDNFVKDIVILASSSTEAVGVLATDEPGLNSPATLVPPALATPFNEATGVDTAPTLSWNSASGATSYHVQVSATSDFGTSIFDEGTTNLTVAVSGLSYDTDYYWRVKAINSEGSSSWSSVWSFRTTSAPTSSLIGHWKMDEGSGTILLDESEYKNKATTTGNPTWVAGISGQAIKLDGATQYATVPDNASLDITGSITLAAWIKPEKAATQYVLKKATLGGIDGYELSLSSQGRVFFRFNQGSSGDTYRLNSSSSYPVDGNTWMHIAATYNGSVMKLYINGVENSSKSFTSPPPISANQLALAIGAQSDGVSKFQGAIDDARVYNTDLRAEQIKELATTASLATARMSSSTATVAFQGKELKDDLQVYPNPFVNQATVNFTLIAEGDFSLTLYDSKGVQVATLKEGRAVAGVKYQTIIDGTMLPKGLYILSLQTGKGIKALKLMVDK